MLIDPLPQNQNMDSRTMDTRSHFGWYKNLSVTEGGHGCINMMLAANVVTFSKDYGSSQPNMGKEPIPPEISLHIDNPEVIPHIPKGVLKHLRHNPNSQATQHYYIIEDVGQTPCAMPTLEVI